MGNKAQTSPNFQLRFNQSVKRIEALRGKIRELEAAVMAENGFIRGIIQAEADSLNFPEGSEIKVSPDGTQISFEAKDMPVNGRETAKK